MNKIISFFADIKNRTIICLSLVLLFASFYVFTYVFRYQGISTGNGGTQEEFLFEYNAAKNFVIKGFFHSLLLPDQSTDFKKESPAVLYTHDPSLTSVVQGILLKIGLNVFQSRIVYALISLAGIVFLYLFVSEIASITAAVFACILLVVNFNGYLSLADSNYFTFGPILLFGYLWARNIKSPKKYFIVPIIVFISSISFYTFLPFILLLEFLFFIVERDKKIFLSSMVVSVAGIFLHIIQNIIVLTPIIAWQDIWLTATNRIFGVPSRPELLKFYQDHNLVLWGSNATKTFASYWYGSIAPFSLFNTPPILGTIVTAFFYFFRRGDIYKSRKTLFLLFLAAFIWQFTFLQAVSAFPIIFHSFLVIFLGIVLSDLLSSFFSWNSASVGVIGSKIVILLIFALIISRYFVWAGTGRESNDENLAGLTGDLRRYQNKTFYTNIHSHKVSFSTQNWVVGSCEYDGLANLDASQCYSKFTSLSNDQLVPDYILLSPTFFVFDCPDACIAKLKSDLKSKYRFIEEKAFGTIYQVKK